MAHGADVRIAGDGTDRIGNALALGCGTGVSGRKSEDASPQVQHGSLMAEPCPGTWLVEERCQFLTLARVGVFFRICLNVPCKIHKFV